MSVEDFRIGGFHIPTPDDCGTDGNGDVFADTKGYQMIDPATRRDRVVDVDDSPKLGIYNPGNNYNRAGALFNSIKEFFDNNFANNTLNRQIFNPEDGNNLHLIG